MSENRTVEIVSPGENGLFPREQDLIEDGLTLTEDLGDKRVYRDDSWICIVAENGFMAQGAEEWFGFEIFAHSDTKNAKMREGTKEELFLLVDLIKMVWERMTPKQRSEAYVVITKDGDEQRRITMFSQFFNLEPIPDAELGQFMFKISPKV